MSDFHITLAHSSRVKKPTTASLRRTASSPFFSLPRKKPFLGRSQTQDTKHIDDFSEQLDDVGLVESLATDLRLRDVAQAVLYVKGKMWSLFPRERTGMNAQRTAEVLGFRKRLPHLVTLTHVQALLNSATVVEREVVELVRGGVLRKIVVGGRGAMGEMLITMKDFEALLHGSGLQEEVRTKFLQVLQDSPMALGIEKGRVTEGDAKALMKAGFLTAATPAWATTEMFLTPGEGSRGTAMSLHSISRAASGSLAAVGGYEAVYMATNRNAYDHNSGSMAFNISIPGAGPYLKLVTAARAHLVSLLSKSRYRESPQTMLKERWEGGIEVGDAGSLARRNRGEFDGVLPGRTRKWKTFYGMSFDWVLGESVGAGLVEVFNTGSVGRGVRVL
ncbi:serine-threonine protein kinase 19-domain-containing protein [Calycina marina]|uniref:Serine-threonine protein kinase 19-domain-containing protein n=1 Tax=Calycina marina TaxID=1763456 RepID=A0A9P7YZK8_9HELO|nr:serine-threonine protein kinase 19-domain-containing protein [Calycina marina]